MGPTSSMGAVAFYKTAIYSEIGGAFLDGQVIEHIGHHLFK
jgi:hypothetical protein